MGLFLLGHWRGRKIPIDVYKLLHLGVAEIRVLAANNRTLSMEVLKGAFIYGIGIEQTEHVLLIANNTLKTTYKICIASRVECNFSSKYENKELEEDEIVLLTLMQLQYLNILEVFKTAAGDLEIIFENDNYLKINGLLSQPNSGNAWRLFQLTPVFKDISISKL